MTSSSKTSKAKRNPNDKSADSPDTMVDAPRFSRIAAFRRRISVWFAGGRITFAKVKPRSWAIGGSLLAVILVGLTVSTFTSRPNFDDPAAMTEKTLAAYVAEAQAEPENMGKQLLLGHALYTAGERLASIRAYTRALKGDPTLADDRMYANVAGCYGTKAQAVAARLVGAFKLAAAADRLRPLLRHKRRGVREAVLQTLGAVDLASNADQQAFYLDELAMQDCNIRRRAVRRLGRFGNKASLPALRQAARQDDNDTPWYRSSCLDDLPALAELKITKRNRIAAR